MFISLPCPHYHSWTQYSAFRRWSLIFSSVQTSWLLRAELNAGGIRAEESVQNICCISELLEISSTMRWCWPSVCCVLSTFQVCCDWPGTDPLSKSCFSNQGPGVRQPSWRYQLWFWQNWLLCRLKWALFFFPSLFSNALPQLWIASWTNMEHCLCLFQSFPLPVSSLQ